MEIELLCHEDNSYVLELKDGDYHQLVDVTEIVNSVFLTKLKEINYRLEAETKYRSWLLETAQTSSHVINKAKVRYSQMRKRLFETNELAQELVTAWKNKEDLVNPVTKLAQVLNQNRHFLINDSTESDLLKQ